MLSSPDVDIFPQGCILFSPFVPHPKSLKVPVIRSINGRLYMKHKTNLVRQSTSDELQTSIYYPTYTLFELGNHPVDFVGCMVVYTLSQGLQVFLGVLN